jgi:hypothetical protein
VGITIVAGDVNRQVVIQPVAITRSSLVLASNPAPASTTSTTMTTFTYPRLTN